MNQDNQQPPANQQQQRDGNPRGRGRGRRQFFRNRDRAQNEINRTAPPVNLDGKFLGFTSVERGNAKVTINHSVTENVTADLRNTIKTNQESKGMFDANGQALDLDYLTRGAGGGLCLSMVLKLIQATPNGELPKIAAYRSFKEYQIQIPKAFSQLIDIVGKTDYQDWVIRIKGNVLLIKRLLLKSLKYFKQNPDFIQDYVFLDQNGMNAFNGLDNYNFRQFRDFYFADQDSVDDIKKRAREWLDEQLATNFQIQIGQNQVTFGYPQLSDTPTQADILAWLAMFVNNVHPNFNNIIRAGVLLLLDLRWLENANQTLVQIDNATFNGTPVANDTPIQCLNACGLRFYTEFLNEAHFIQLTRGAFVYYESTITQRMKVIMSMITQASSIYGNPAQLVLIPEDMRRNRDDYNLHRVDIDPMLNHCISYVKLDVSHAVIKAAMCNLVDEVDLDPDYEGHFSNALAGIRRGFFSQDGLVFSQQRLYN